MSFLQNGLQQDKGIPGAVKEVELTAETTVPSAGGPAIRETQSSVLVHSAVPRNNLLLVPIYWLGILVFLQPP